MNFNVYTDDEEETVCNCGSKNYRLNGYSYTSTGKFQRYRCVDCGREVRAGQNLLSKDKRKNLKGVA
jgi:transposase-like protein